MQTFKNISGSVNYSVFKKKNILICQALQLMVFNLLQTFSTFKTAFLLMFFLKQFSNIGYI